MQIATGSASVIERNGITSRGRADNPRRRKKFAQFLLATIRLEMIRDARIKGMCFVSLTMMDMYIWKYFLNPFYDEGNEIGYLEEFWKKGYDF